MPTNGNNSSMNPKSEIIFSRNQSALLKGLAILLVIINHLGECFGFPGPLGAIGVSMFLMLSGYGLNESFNIKKNTTGYWHNKFIGVYLPYMFLSIPTIFIFEGLNFKLLLNNFTLYQPYYQYGWYLNILLILYFVFWLSASIRRTSYRLAVIGVSAIFIFLFYNNIGKIQGFSFFLGVILSQYKSFAIKLRNYWMLWIGLGIMSYFLFRCSYFLPYPAWALRMWSVSFFIGNGLCLLFSALFDRKFQILKFIGTISFELYIIHGYYIPVVKQSKSLGSVFMFLILTGISSYVYFLVWQHIKKRFTKQSTPLVKEHES